MAATLNPWDPSGNPSGIVQQHFRRRASHTNSVPFLLRPTPLSRPINSPTLVLAFFAFDILWRGESLYIMAGFLKSLIPGDYPTLQISSFFHSVFDTEESLTYQGLRIWFYGYVTWSFDYSVIKGMIEMMHTGHSCRSFRHDPWFRHCSPNPFCL